MNNSQPSWHRLLPLGLFLLLLVGAAGASLTVINLRQDQARLAAFTYKLRGELTETNRHLQEMTATVAAAVQPSTLRARVGTRLSPMTDKQIVWVTPGATTIEARQPASAPASSFRFASADPSATPHLLQ